MRPHQLPDQVFISYSRRNSTFALRLFNDLQAAGLRVWIDVKRIRGGDTWRASIETGLNGSYNILRKVYPDAYRGLTGVALHGVKVASNAIEKHLRTWGVSHNGRRGAKRRNCIRSAPVGGTSPTNFEALE